MSDLQHRFETAQRDVRLLRERPDNATLLRLYALYKQGVAGDVSGEPPGFFDFVGAAKYEAWKAVSGMSREEAMGEYIGLVRKLAAA